MKIPEPFVTCICAYCSFVNSKIGRICDTKILMVLCVE